MESGTTSIATLVVAAVTGLLVIATLLLVAVNVVLAIGVLWQGRLARRALDLSIRPLLADPGLPAGEYQEEVEFGTPGRMSRKVPVGALWYSDDGQRISLPFRNVGAGVAVITGATTEPGSESAYTTRKFVPPGEYVRINVTRRMRPTTEPSPEAHWWAMSGFAILIHYTDAAGRQSLVSRADFTQAATAAPRVATISIFENGKSKPFAVGESSV